MTSFVRIAFAMVTLFYLPDEIIFRDGGSGGLNKKPSFGECQGLSYKGVLQIAIDDAVMESLSFSKNFGMSFTP